MPGGGESAFITILIGAIGGLFAAFVALIYRYIGQADKSVDEANARTLAERERNDTLVREITATLSVVNQNVDNLYKIMDGYLKVAQQATPAIVKPPVRPHRKSVPP